MRFARDYGTVKMWEIGRYTVKVWQDGEPPTRWFVMLEVFRGDANYMLLARVQRNTHAAAMRKGEAVSRAFARKIAVEVLR